MSASAAALPATVSASMLPHDTIPAAAGDRSNGEASVEPAPTERGAAASKPWRAAAEWLRRYELALWWLHSAWALAFGIGAMWLGARNFEFLRVAFVQVAFIWTTSLFLPRLARSPRLTDRTRGWMRVAVNYLNKNFYQQVLFFVLPVYWASVTIGSRNLLFVVLVALSALLATVDVVYDRQLSVRRSLTAAFFAFNLFACVNVALPVLWSVSNAASMRLAALVAGVGFVTLRVDARDLRRRPVIVALLTTILVLGGMLEWGRRFVPPAPLRVVSSQFGTGFDARSLIVTAPQDRLDTGWRGTVYVLTAIRAPLGLRDRVRHRWSMNGRELRTTAFHTVAGGRARGFRFWSAVQLQDLPHRGMLLVDVETEGGQLIGRARLPVGL